MQTDFFSDTKKKASFGRNTESRAAFRKLLVQQNAAGIENRRGKKRHADEEETSTLTPTRPFDSSSRILEKTLKHLAEESLESKRQKRAEMAMRQIWDKLVAQRQKEDAMIQLFDRLSRAKKKPDQGILKKKILQSRGTLCRSKKSLTRCKVRNIVVTATKSTKITWSSQLPLHPKTRRQQLSEPIVPSSRLTTMMMIMISMMDVVNVNVVARVNTTNTNDNNGCIECNLPLNHSCRKCKKCICSLCCSEKRELENA